MKRMRLSGKRLLIILLAAVMLAAAPVLWYFLLHGRTDATITLDGTPDPALAGQSAHVHVVDVGQGDAVLLEQGGEYALIDTGTPTSKEALTFYLDAHGVRSLKYLILTHFHADHIGGALQILENFQVETVLMPDLELAPMPTAYTALELLETLEQRSSAGKLQVHIPAAGDSFALGAGEITVLGSGIPCAEDANNTSLITLFTFDTFRYFSAGDAEAEAEAELLSRLGGTLRADLYKASHHGSSTSSTQALLDELRPKAAVFSCGADNDYGHPHTEVTQRLLNAGTRYWRTDLEGSILFTVKDGTLEIRPEKRG